MNVTVIGTGYVGLTTGVSLAHMGHQVVCVDVDEDKVRKLQQGISPIYEPGLDELLLASMQHLTFTTSYEAAVAHAEVIFLAVGTPSNSDGSPNLSYIFGAVKELLLLLRSKTTPTLLVNKSTVPVGTGHRIMEEVRRWGLDPLVEVASNPEFLRQGRAMYDTLHPDRVVVGGSDGAAAILNRLYKPILCQSLTNDGISAEIPYIHVDIRSAELAKYAANAYLAMKISFINEMANVCDSVGADVTHIAEIIGTDPRIGPSFLQAGIGYGGSCFPKDTKALRYIADTNGYDFKLLSAVIEVNNGQKFRLLDKLRSEAGDLAGKKIAVLGLTFKPGTDDLRDAPSIPIIHALTASGAEVFAHDPIASDRAASLFPASIRLGQSLEETLRDADAALLLTEWEEYTALSAADIRRLMKRPLLIDGRNAYRMPDSEELHYIGMGKSGGRDAPMPELAIMKEMRI
jgi:UDPglucose 6-dehydrogenase